MAELGTSRDLSRSKLPARRPSVARRVALALALVALGVLGFGVATAVFGIQSLRSADEVSRALIPVNRDTNSLLTAYVDEETGERGYILTGETRFLQPFYAGEAESRRLTEALRRHLSAEPQADAALRAVLRVHDTWFRDTALAEIKDVRTGAPARAVAAERTGAGKRRFDRLRAAVSSLERIVTSKEAVTVSSLHRRAATTVALAVTEALAALAMLVGCWVLLRRWVTRPITALESEVSAVAAGDLDHRISMSGLAEMVSLGQSVESMRESLRADSEELKHLRAALVASDILEQQLSRELVAVGSTQRLDIAGQILPAGGVLAGDWYDAWPLSEETVAVALIDVSGHGAATGIFALQVKTLLTAASSGEIPPGDVFGQLASELGDTDDRFVTGIIIHVNTTTGECHYANAGHPGGLIVGGQAAQLLEPTGPLLGPFPAAWSTKSFTLGHDDVVVLCTDGVVDARRMTKDAFGLEGIHRAVEQGESVRPVAVVERVIRAVSEECQMPLADDATVVACKIARSGPPSAD